MFVCFCLGCGLCVCVCLAERFVYHLRTKWANALVYTCVYTDRHWLPSGASCRFPLAPLVPLHSCLVLSAYPLRQCLADQREASTDHIEKSKSWEMVRIQLLLLVTLVGLSLCQVSSCTLSFSHRLTTAWWQQLYKNLTTAPQQLDDSLTIALWQWNILDTRDSSIGYLAIHLAISNIDLPYDFRVPNAQQRCPDLS